jgi:hypothetical protein
MRMLLSVQFPHEPFNTLVRKKTAGPLMMRILEDLKPEATYFVEAGGKRTGIFIVDVPDPSRVPSFAEPFFLHFNADCRFRVVMSAQELQRAGLDALADKWS